MPGAPVDAVTRARIVELASEGKLSRNQIAREVGIAGSTVSRIAKDAGIVFDTTNSELAVAVRSAKAAELRQLVAIKMLHRASEALDDMDAPTVTGHWSNATEHLSSQYLEHTMDGPTISDRRNLMTIAAIGFQRAGELLDKVDTTKLDAGRSVLESLARGLSAASASILSEVDPTVVPDAATAKAEYEDLVNQVDEVPEDAR